MSFTEENAVDLLCVGGFSLRSRRHWGGKTYRSFQKHESQSLHDLYTGRYLLRISFISNL